MALQKLAAIAVRPRRHLADCGVAMFAAVTAAGCSHSRQSYRPVYATPAPVAAPCTNCGSARRRRRSEPGIAPVSSVPSLSEYVNVGLSSAARDVTGRGRATDRAASSTVEKPPKATARRRAGLRRNDRSPAPPGNEAAATPPPPTPNAGPAQQGPHSKARAHPPLPPAAWDTDSTRSRARRATTAKSVRRASLSERLRPFVDESSANELIYPNKADRPWRYIVLHHSASASGNYDQIDGEHRKILGIDGCGYHFVIGNGTGSGDGQIEVAQRWNNQKQGAHCRNARTHDVDEYGIGICLVGDFDQQPPIAASDRRGPGPDRLPQQALQHRARAGVTTHAHLRRHQDGLPGQVFPERSDSHRDQGRA